MKNFIKFITFIFILSVSPTRSKADDTLNSNDILERINPGQTNGSQAFGDEDDLGGCSSATANLNNVVGDGGMLFTGNTREAFCLNGELNSENLDSFRTSMVSLTEKYNDACGDTSSDQRGDNYGEVFKRVNGLGTGDNSAISDILQLESVCRHQTAIAEAHRNRTGELEQEAFECAQRNDCLNHTNLVDMNAVGLNNENSSHYAIQHIACGDLIQGDGNAQQVNYGATVKIEHIQGDNNFDAKLIVYSSNGNAQKEIKLHKPTNANPGHLQANKAILNKLISSIRGCAGIKNLNEEFTDVSDTTPPYTNNYAMGQYCRGDGPITKDYNACKKVVDALQTLTVARVGFQAFQQVQGQVQNADIQATAAEQQAEGQSVTTGLNALERNAQLQGSQALQQAAANGAEMAYLWTLINNFPISDKFTCDNNASKGLLGKPKAEFVNHLLSKISIQGSLPQHPDPDIVLPDNHSSSPHHPPDNLPMSLKSAFYSIAGNFEGRDTYCEQWRQENTFSVLRRAFMNQNIVSFARSRMMMAGIGAGLNGLQAFLANRRANTIRDAINDLEAREEEFQPGFDENLLINKCAVDPTLEGCDPDRPNFNAPMGFTMGGNPLGGGGGSGGGVVQGAFQAAEIDPFDSASSDPSQDLTDEEEAVLAGGLAEVADDTSGSLAGQFASGNATGINAGSGGGGGGGGGGASASGGQGGENPQNYANNKPSSSGGRGEGAGGTYSASGGWTGSRGGKGAANVKNPFIKGRNPASTKDRILNFKNFPSFNGGRTIFDRISNAYQGAAKSNRLEEYEAK